MAKKVKIEGEVIVRGTDGKGSVIDFYEQEFIIEGLETEAQARSVIKNGLLSDRLRKVVKGYKRFRTYEIVSFEDTDKKSEDSELDELLIKAQKENCMPENLSIYAGATGKKKALKKSIDNSEKRKKQPKKKDGLSEVID